MYAKLIICQDEPVNSSGSKTSIRPDRVTQLVNYSHWQLAANNLTTGKLVDLFACLDELGFSEVETS